MNYLTKLFLTKTSDSKSLIISVFGWRSVATSTNKICDVCL